MCLLNCLGKGFTFLEECCLCNTSYCRNLETIKEIPTDCLQETLAWHRLRLDGAGRSFCHLNVT